MAVERSRSGEEEELGGEEEDWSGKEEDLSGKVGGGVNRHPPPSVTS